MKNWTLIVAFAVGLMTAVVIQNSGELVAKGKKKVTTWEFKCIPKGVNAAELGKQMTELGKQGWDMGGLTTAFYCMKRPL